MSWREAGDPHRYGSETVWPEKSHGAEMSAGPHGRSRCVSLSYWREGRWERIGKEGGKEEERRRGKNRGQVENKRHHAKQVREKEKQKSGDQRCRKAVKIKENMMKKTVEGETACIQRRWNLKFKYEGKEDG